MNPYRSGKLVLFQVTYDRDWHFFEIIFFVILGIFGVRLLSNLRLAPSRLPFTYAGSLRRLHGQVQYAVGRIPQEASG